MSRPVYSQGILGHEDSVNLMQEVHWLQNPSTSTACTCMPGRKYADVESWDLDALAAFYEGS